MPARRTAQGSLRTAHCYGLDRFCGDLPLAHCAAEADLGDVLKLMLMEGEEGEEMRRVLDMPVRSVPPMCRSGRAAVGLKLLGRGGL